MREEIEEVVTTEEYLNGNFEGEVKNAQLNDSKCKLSTASKPKFTVTSYTIDPPPDRFKDSLCFLNHSVGSTTTNIQRFPLFSEEYTDTNCDAKANNSHANETLKVPFPEFGVDLILSTPTEGKLNLILLLMYLYFKKDCYPK